MGLRSTSALRSSILGLLLGVLAFVIIFDIRQVIPQYIDWQIQGDPAQHYLGWLFFRYEPWRFPLGSIAGYGTPDGSSIVFTDSIPLFALLFKLVSAWLPERFQYTGIWLLLCYALQGWFGWLLASLICHGRYPKALLTGFFLLSTILVFRCQDGHHALMAHWLLLAAIYLSVQSRQQFETRYPRLSWSKSWIVLVVLSGTIHLYLTAMIVPMYMATWFDDWLHRPAKERARSLGAPVITLVLLAVTLYAEGAFVVRPGNWVDRGSGNFGRFSMNLLAPISPGYWSNPDDANYMSLFIEPHRHFTDGQYEGVNFLGFGFLMLIAATAVLLLWSTVRYLRGDEASVGQLPPVRLPAPMMPVLVIFTLFALSHRAGLGAHTLYSIRFSPQMLDRFAVFRASGRFFWPCYYVILFFGFQAFVWATRRRPQLFAMGLHLAFTLQAVDLSQFIQRYAKRHRQVTAYRSPLVDSAWRRLVQQYDEVVYYPPNESKLYVPLGLIAAPHQVGINVSYKARSDPTVVTQSESIIRRALQSGDLAPRSLYVFENADLFENLKKLPNADAYTLRRLDGYYVAGRKTKALRRD